MGRRIRIPRLLVSLAVLAWLALPAATASAQYGDSGGGSAQPSGGDGDKSSDRRWRAKSDQERDEEKAAAARQVGRRTGRFLGKSREYMSAEKYDEAMAILDRLNLKRLNPYERALVYRTKGYLHYFKKEYDPAVDLLRKALDEKIFPAVDHNDILFSIAQIYSTAEQWQKAVDTYKEWFATQEKPSPNGHFQLAVVYFRMEKPDEALVEAKRAVELADNPQQGWLQLLLNLYLTKQDFKAATPVLVTLLSRYPQVGKAYWLQLATLYGVQEQMERALAILQLAHRMDFLTEDRDLKRLVGLLQTNEIPIRAAKVLSTALEQKRVKEDSLAYELLGNSFIMARESEKAEAPLRRAAQLSPEGDLSVRLGQVLLLKEDYDGAAGALKEALAKGGLDDPGNVELLLGITYYNLGNLGEAKTWFTRSRRSDKARETADAWIEHIDTETQKKAEQNGVVAAGN